MTAQETFVTDGARTTLTSGLTDAGTTINVASSAGFPSVPFYATIDPGNASKREIVLVDSGTTATTFTLTNVSKRGMGATSPVAHDSGAVIAVVPVSLLWEDINDRVDSVAAATTDHGNLQGLNDNDHPQYALKTGTTFTGAVSLSDQNLSRANLIDYSEQIVTTTVNSSPVTIDYTQGQVVALTLDTSASLLVSNAPTQSGSLMLIITQGTGGSKTLTFSFTVRWAGGVAPTLSTATGAVDIITLVKGAGTTWYGFLGGRAFA